MIATVSPRLRWTDEGRGLVRHIALLRAVNVGGKAKVAMADLRALAGAEGWHAPQTLLQSGNLLFAAAGEQPAEIERRLQSALEQRLGLVTDVFVRAPAAWDRYVAANPFPRLAADDPGHLVLVPLKAAAGDGAEATLGRAIVGREQVAVRGDVAYIAYPDGIGRSKLTMAVLERLLGARGTGRNWNTVLRIAAALRV